MKKLKRLEKREAYPNGEFYRKATIDELRAASKMNEMMMNRNVFNEVFEVSKYRKRDESL